MFGLRAEQTTTTTSTGTVDLQAALTGRVNFVDVFGNGVQCYYNIQTADESQWEEGIGTVVAGTPDQLQRNTVLRSSNSNNLVNFPAGTKTVFSGIDPDQLRLGGAGQLPTVGGSANAITLAFTMPLKHLRGGMFCCFVPTADNTTAATVNVNTIGNVNVTRAGGFTLEAGDLKNGYHAWLYHTGTNWILLNPQPQILLGLAHNFPGAVNEAPSIALTAASTTNVGAAASNVVTINGSTTITGFDTVAFGIRRKLYFNNAPLLTQNVTSMILFTAANIQTRAGDVAEFMSLGSGNWIMLGYERQDGTALVNSGAGGYFSGLYVRPGATSASQLRATADVLVLTNSSGLARTLTSFDATADFTVNGAVNRLDTGSLSSGNWYHLWAISDGTTNGVLGSLSATTPTMPSGYTYKMYLGAAYYTSGSFLAFRQYGRRAEFVANRSMASGTSGTFDSSRTAIGLSTFVPLGKASVIFGSLFVTGSVNVNGASASMSATGIPVAYAGPNSSIVQISFSGVIDPATNSMYYSSGGGSNNLYVSGYELNL